TDTVKGVSKREVLTCSIMGRSRAAARSRVSGTHISPRPQRAMKLTRSGVTTSAAVTKSPSFSRSSSSTTTTSLPLRMSSRASSMESKRGRSGMGTSGETAVRVKPPPGASGSGRPVKNPRAASRAILRGDRRDGVLVEAELDVLVHLGEDARLLHLQHRRVDAADGDDAVALLDGVDHGLPLVLALALRPDDEEVEHHEQQPHHDEERGVEAGGGLLGEEERELHGRGDRVETRQSTASGGPGSSGPGKDARVRADAPEAVADEPRRQPVQERHAGEPARERGEASPG